MQMNDSATRSDNFHFYTFWIMLYYLFAPMEDLLTGRMGTVAKYIAIIIAFCGLNNKGWTISLERNSVKRCIMYLLFLSAASCIWATDLSVAINRNVAYLLVPGLAWFVGQLEFSRKEREAIVTAAIVGGLLTVAYLAVSGQINVVGTQRLQLNAENDQNNFAALMFLPLGLCVERIMNLGKKKKIKYAAFAMIFLYIILLTGSRGALLSILMFVCVLAVFSTKGNKMRTIFGLFVLVVFSYYVILPMLPESIQTRLFSNDSYTNTMNAKENRGAFWKLAFTEIIPQNLPLGVGSGCTPLWLGKFFSGNFGMHNTYINMLCEYGFFGLPAFLWMLWSLFKEKLRQKETFEMALLVGICVIIFFLDAYPRKFFWNIIMLLLIGNKAKSETAERRNTNFM